MTDLTTALAHFNDSKEGTSTTIIDQRPQMFDGITAESIAAYVALAGTPYATLVHTARMAGRRCYKITWQPYGRPGFDLVIGFTAEGEPLMGDPIKDPRSSYKAGVGQGWKSLPPGAPSVVFDLFYALMRGAR